MSCGTPQGVMKLPEESLFIQNTFEKVLV